LKTRLPHLLLSIYIRSVRSRYVEKEQKAKEEEEKEKREGERERESDRETSKTEKK
jgi:hypothetical protein